MILYDFLSFHLFIVCHNMHKRKERNAQIWAPDSDEGEDEEEARETCDEDARSKTAFVHKVTDA